MMSRLIVAIAERRALQRLSGTAGQVWRDKPVDSKIDWEAKGFMFFLIVWRMFFVASQSF